MVIVLISVVLMALGIWGLLMERNMLKLVFSFNIFGTGLNLLIVSVGFIPGKAAPILDLAHLRQDAVGSLVDPLPSVLVLTSIVIGVVITAVMLVFVVLYYRKTGSLMLPDKGI
ncbi:MAG: cation:proton antiporter subunit C [Candidatus Cloacimonadaceae bacterium]|nr:cation:proton antiporter subunit C [Candidatus Cloacimonadaceae bacterium]